MTKYFKLLGIALLATSMAFVSCGDDGDDTTDPGTGTNPPVVDPQPDPEPGSAVVTFGDNTWTPYMAASIYYPTYGVMGVVAISEETGEGYPRADVYVYADGVGTYTDELNAEGNAYTNEVINYVEYYDDNALDDGTYLYGDWWAKTMTMNVTAFDATAMTMSANVNAVMFDAEAVFYDGVAYEEAELQTMIVAAEGIELINGKAAKGNVLAKLRK